MFKLTRFFLVTNLIFWCVILKSSGQAVIIPKELYLASTIPDSLKENANSVIRYAIEQDDINAPGRITEKFHSIVSILNEKGDDQAEKVLPYNKKYSSVNSFELKIYNKDGELIKKYHKGDMYDRLAIDNESLITDDRVLAIRHTVVSYPVTVETIYEMDVKSTVDLGTWEIEHPEQSVQNSYYQISIKNDAGFRYSNRNIKIKPEKISASDFDHYLWSVKGIKAIKLETGSEAWSVLPTIRFASNSFECYGVPGNFDSWKAYGNWQKALNADVCSLSPAREEEIRKMTDTIKTDKGKAKFLYKYLQENMRYVSIQLGIGGLKPFPAPFVDEKKYGDCKALTNYMGALLRAVKIPSYYSIVNAGSNQEAADPSFPSDPFDHVILCIPFKNDTTWLECTSNITPFGKLGPFTENRMALLVTEDGGKLVNTPKSTPMDNVLESEAHVTLDADGGARAAIKFFCTGEYRANFIGLTSLKLDEQKETIMRLFNIKQPSEFDYKAADDKEDVKEIDLNLDYDRFCDVMAGDKQFYRPCVFDLCTFTVPVEDKRKTDYYFEMPLQKSCTITIDLPAGYEIETLPANQNLKFTYGSYEVSYNYNLTKNQVVSVARFNINNHIIPASKYTELQQYLDAVAKAQNKKMVIKRKA